MVKIFCAYRKPAAHIQRSFPYLIILNVCGKFTGADRPVPVGKMIADNRFKRVAFTGNGAVNPQFVSGNKNRLEHGKAHDVIPVGVGDKYISVNAAFFFEILSHKPIAQRPHACAKINNNKFFTGAYFKA
jgi:hypothetical protein